MVQPDRACPAPPHDYHSVSTHPRLRRPFCAFAFLALASACGAGEKAPPPPRDFDPALAWAHLGQQMAFGPRVSGYKRHDMQLNWMRKELSFRADTLVVQEFTAPGLRGQPVRYANVLARWRPELKERVLLVTHWDSPPYATRDPEPAKRRRPVPGANDGASGTAVLMELAQIFHETPTPVGVDLLFTDGMERGDRKEGLGVRHFIASAPATYRWAVYVDRVGDRDLRIPMEGASTPAVARRVWDVARELGRDSVFTAGTGAALPGDHRVLAAAGIPIAAVIDPEYGRGNELWRTVDDDLDNVRRESLGEVGAVLAALVYREKAAP